MLLFSTNRFPSSSQTCIYLDKKDYRVLTRRVVKGEIVIHFNIFHFVLSSITGYEYCSNPNVHVHACNLEIYSLIYIYFKIPFISKLKRVPSNHVDILGFTERKSCNYTQI